MRKRHYMLLQAPIQNPTNHNLDILSHYATNNIQNHVFTNKLHSNIPTPAFMAGSN